MLETYNRIKVDMCNKNRRSNEKIIQNCGNKRIASNVYFKCKCRNAKIIYKHHIRGKHPSEYMGICRKCFR